MRKFYEADGDGVGGYKLKDTLTPEQLIVRQQLEIENLKKEKKENVKLLENIKARFISIGAPLNDNCLQFNNEQLKWCAKVYNLIEQL